jgi:hypothetical protein
VNAQVPARTNSYWRKKGVVITMKDFPHLEPSSPKISDDRFRLGEAAHAILLFRRNLDDYNEALERLGVSHEELDEIIAKLRLEIPS